MYLELWPNSSLFNPSHNLAVFSMVEFEIIPLLEQKGIRIQKPVNYH